MKKRMLFMSKAKKLVTKLASLADIQMNGSNPWDITVKDERFYNRLLKESSLGLGESYMDGWWECSHIDEMIHHLMRAGLETKVKKNLKLLSYFVLAKIFNFQTKRRATIVGEKHYDTGNDLFEKMLDKEMSYTCGYWKNATNLDQAQEAKLDLTCQKLHLKPGMKVLDIGCGWGAFARHAAKNYGVEVVGVTISKEQVALGRKLSEGLPIDLRFQDYRDIHEKFDRIVSLGMFEHVGYKNYKTYMKKAFSCLKEHGIFLLHTIGSNQSGVNADPWLNKYIFPNGMLPSIKQIAKATEKLFVMEDWHNFGSDYDKTLQAWRANFINAWDQLKSHYSERFYRMWIYYLSCCAGVFRSRDIQLWQIVLSKNGLPEGYTSIR